MGERSGGVSPSSSSTCRGRGGTPPHVSRGEGHDHLACGHPRRAPAKRGVPRFSFSPGDIRARETHAKRGVPRSSARAILARGDARQHAHAHRRSPLVSNRCMPRCGAEAVHVHGALHTFELAPCRRAMARCCAFAAGLIGAFRSISAPPIPPPPPPSPPPSASASPPPTTTLTLLSMLPPRTRRAVSGCSSSRRAFSSTHLREYDDGWSEVGRHMRR